MLDTCYREQYSMRTVVLVIGVTLGVCLLVTFLLIVLSSRESMRYVGHRPVDASVVVGSTTLSEIGTVVFSATGTQDRVRIDDHGVVSGTATVARDTYTDISFDVACEIPDCTARINDRGHLVGWARLHHASGKSTWISFSSRNDHDWDTPGVQEAENAYGVVLTKQEVFYGKAYLYGHETWLRFPCDGGDLPCADAGTRVIRDRSS